MIRIKITPDIQHDELIVKAEHADFLKQTRINETRPNVDLTVTSCCQYEKLMEQISVSQYILQEEVKEDVPLQDAAVHWYDTTYIPLAEAIRDRGLLHWFPNRTITDLYIWISENRAELEKELGWDIKSDIAVTDLIVERSVKSEPGSWRKARTARRYTDRLFEDILIPLSGFAESWDALDQAIIISQRENAKIHGLHVVDVIDDVDCDDAIGIKLRFNDTCKKAGVKGTMAVDVGDITERICERAVLTDLIIMKITRPPSRGISTFRSSYRTIISKSSRPLLTVPGGSTEFKHALLAFDGSDRSKEALFVAAYFAEMWQTKLSVFTALDGKKVTASVQDHVRSYLELHEVEAEYMISEQGETDFLKQIVEEKNIDLVLMGSHGGSVIDQVLVGSALDYMLRESPVPTFICR
jgi:nucleotide-binding universal stress UspA family protein